MGLSKNKKIIYLILGMFFVLLLTFNLPTFARFKNRTTSYSNVWSGMVATQYKSGTGTINDPYIISNCEELAYFSSQLENNNYEGVYFKISNDLLINDGIFKYEDNLIKYVVNDTTYYVLGDKYYDNSDYLGEPIGDINVFPSLSNFKGVLDGDYHTIYGYYGDNALFSDLSGEVTSLYFENALVSGTGNLAIFADNIVSASVSNIMVDGIIIGNTFNSNINDIMGYLSDYEDITDGVIGAVASYSDDSVFINIISKAKIYGGVLSGGIVGYMNDSSIANAYNTGLSTSYISNSIGVIKGDSVVDRIYNTGVINGGLIGYVIDSGLDISNSFIITDNKLVSDSTNSTITSSDNYYVFYHNDDITSTQVLIDDLKDSSFLTSYSEFVSFEDLETNSMNVWVFDDGLPVLYIDDVINSYVELSLNTYVWNSYSPELDVKNINTNITFMISDISDVHTSDKYYYISNSSTPLSKTDLESVSWTPYSDIVRIDNEGFYVVYVKVVDNNDNVSYINSDLLVLDNSGSDITISALGNNWTGSNIGNLYVNQAFQFSVSASDVLSGVKSVEYYLGNSTVNDFGNVSWTSYTGPISVNTVGDYILYVKVTDQCDFVTYASSPLITYDGYVISNLRPLGSSGNSITSNSIISFDVDYLNNKQLSFDHYLVSSILLPRYTNITMIDRVNNKVYGYVVNTNDRFGFDTNGYASYPFTLFKEKGKSADLLYTNSSVSNERFTFIIDFSSAVINSSYNNISIYLNGVSNGSIIRPTISSGLFSISNDRNMKLSHSVSTSFNGNIIYHSDSSTDITISSLVSYNAFYDTSYSDKKIGLSIKVVDGSGRIISKEHLKNITFQIDGVTYLPTNDGIIRVNLSTNSSVDNILSIITHDSSSNLKDGTYYIKISPYASYDGIYSDSVLSNSIMIPLIVSKKLTSLDYNFDVSFPSVDKIVDKGSTVNYSFNILQDGLDSPNIRVSMYQKDELTAYNQDYTLVDLQDYVDSTLDRFIDGVYYVTRNAHSYSVNSEYNEFSINLDTSTLDKTCYKFVFDLYDGNIKVASISKYIIVR